MNRKSRTPKLNLFVGTTQDRPALASVLMVSSLLMLSFQDSLVKVASQSITLWQFQCLRSIMNLLLLMILARIIWGSAAMPRPKRPWAVFLRSIMHVMAMVFFFGGVVSLNLSDIAAGLYTFPLFVAVLSVVFLGERVGIRRTLAIIAGFLGTLLILKPGSEGFTLVSLMPVGAGVSYAGTVLVTRKFCREESPVTLAYGVAILFIIVGMLGISVFSFEPFPELARDWPYLFTGWQSMSLLILGVVAICSLLNVISNINLAKAYQSAEVSWLAPFDYSYLVFATFWGYLMWDQIPDGYSILGMMFISGAGVFVAWRENKPKNVMMTRLGRHWRSLARALFDPI